METGDESGKSVHLEFTSFGLLWSRATLRKNVREWEWSFAPRGYLYSLLSILLPDLLYKGMLLGVGDQPALIEEMEFLSSQLRNLAPRYWPKPIALTAGLLSLSNDSPEPHIKITSSNPTTSIRVGDILFFFYYSVSPAFLLAKLRLLQTMRSKKGVDKEASSDLPWKQGKAKNHETGWSKSC